MSDMIDRQAAIKAADSIIERDTSGNNDVVKAMTAWKEYIEALPSAQRWIPCDVRTPKHVEESYWICTDTGYQCQCRWTNNVFGLGASDEWDWKLLDIPQYSRVVAWMPLPEPWKGEQP